MICWRIMRISSLASWMFLQTPVPISTTDWCISGLTRSSSSILPFCTISAWMCERRSRVTGSTVWYSSSIPMLRARSEHSIRRLIGCLRPTVPETSPSDTPAAAGGASALRDRHVRHRLHDPAEILRPHRFQARIRRRIHEIDGVRNAVLHGELHRVQVVAQRAAELQRSRPPCARPAPARAADCPARSADGAAGPGS